MPPNARTNNATGRPKETHTAGGTAQLGANSHHKFVIVPTPVYWAAWWFVLAIHIFTAIFVSGAALVHIALSLPAVHASTAMIGIPIGLKQLTGITYVVVTLLHVAAVVRLLRRSLRAGHLALHDECARVASTKSKSNSTSSTRSIISPQRSKGLLVGCIRRLLNRITGHWWAVFGTDGYLGINGPLFTSALVYRELVEVVLQSYQLWSLSLNVSRVWISTFAVTAVVANSLSIPAVNVLFHRRETSRRLMHLVVDMVFEFSCAVVIPVCVLAPYWVQFDWKTSSYPIDLLMDDAWLANAIGEARQILVTSRTDYVATLLPQYSIFSCLRILKRLMCQRPPPNIASHRAAIVPRCTASGPLLTSGSTRQPHVQIETVVRETRAVRLVSACIVVCGLSVLAVHILAVQTGRANEIAGCRDYVRPWFVSKVSCTVLYINCHRRKINGSAQEMSDLLALIERPALKKLAFIHCPALIVPAAITQFHRLRGLEIYNSTLVNWSNDAVIQQKTFPKLATVYFGRTNVSAIPDALLHRQLPSTLTRIGFFNCSIAHLPENLGDLWGASHLSHLSFESTRVRTLPASFHKLRLRRLWITGSEIEVIPDDLLASSRLESLRLSANPLQRLPSGRMDTTRLMELMVEHTNVSSLPNWAASWLRSRESRKDDPSPSSFFSSPVCDTADASIREHICSRDLGSKYGFVPYAILERKFAL